MYQLSDVTRLRANLKDFAEKTSIAQLRKEFEEKNRAAWQELLAEHNEQRSVQKAVMEQELSVVLKALNEQGVTKKDLAAAYGTKDYGTITRKIAQVLPAERKTPLLAYLDDDLTAEYGQNVWTIQANDYGGFTGAVRVYRDSDGYPMLLDGEMTNDFRGTQLHQEIAGSSEGDFSTLWREME